MLLYVLFLASVSLVHYTETPRVFFSAVRDFPWGIRNAARCREEVHDPHVPVPFPNSTLPTFDQAFSTNGTKLEGGYQYAPNQLY